MVCELLGTLDLSLEVEWGHRLFYLWIKLYTWDTEACTLLAQRAVTTVGTEAVIQVSSQLWHDGMPSLGASHVA